MKKGFTVSETLIVMAIIGILSIISFPFFNSAKDQLSVQRSASQLAQDVRFTIEKAISIEKYNCPSPYGDVYQYGVYFNINSPDSYILFADCDKNLDFNSNDEIISKIFFEDRVRIQNLKVGNNNRNEFNIVFIPPKPDVNINQGAIESFVDIGLNSFSKTIKINAVGLIDID